MRFSLLHIFNVTAIAAIALGLRACWIALEDDGFILTATIIIATVVGIYVGWYRARFSRLLIAVLGAAILMSSMFALELVFHSPGAMFSRDRIAIYYFDSPQFNFSAVVVHSVIATVVGTLAGHLISRNHDWIRINSMSLKIVLAVAIATGFMGYHFGPLAFPRVAPSRLSFWSSILGIVFGVAWASSYRSFPASVKSCETLGNSAAKRKCSG